MTMGADGNVVSGKIGTFQNPFSEQPLMISLIGFYPGCRDLSVPYRKNRATITFS